MMKLKNLILFLGIFILILATSACSFSSKPNDDNWEDEVLMAQSCGEEGLMCCLDMEPVCKYGSCCYDPNNFDNNYCSDDCTFGKLDTFCGENNTCDEGLACSDSYCSECGEVEQPCCGGDVCDGDLSCFRGTCVTCGVEGNPCCDADTKCFFEKSEGLDRTQCKDEICSACGANSNEPCIEAPRCNKNHLQNNGSCYRCGGFNQPCCLDTDYEGTEKYCVEDGLSCKLDFCSK